MRRLGWNQVAVDGRSHQDLLVVAFDKEDCEFLALEVQWIRPSDGFWTDLGKMAMNALPVSDEEVDDGTR